MTCRRPRETVKEAVTSTSLYSEPSPAMRAHAISCAADEEARATDMFDVAGRGEGIDPGTQCAKTRIGFCTTEDLSKKSPRPVKSARMSEISIESFVDTVA